MPTQVRFDMLAVITSFERETSQNTGLSPPVTSQKTPSGDTFIGQQSPETPIIIDVFNGVTTVTTVTTQKQAQPPDGYTHRNKNENISMVVTAIASAYETTGDPERKAKLMGLFKNLDVRLGKGDPVMDVVRHAHTALNAIK